MTINYEYTPLYYATPVQVRYFDFSTGEYNNGMAYHDELFTHDGQVLPITTCLIEAQARSIHWDSALIEQEWVDLNNLK